MSTEEFLSLAIELISAGKKENARTAIRQVLDSDPDNVNAWALLVQVAKSPDEEMNAIREVLRLKPDDSWAQRYLADLVDKEALNRIIDLIKLERKEQAVFLLDQVLSRSPNNPDAWALKARLAGKREDAIIALEEVLRLRPDDDRARQYLTRLINEQQEIERKRIEKAQKEEEEKLRQSMGAPVETTEKKKRRLSSDIIYGLMGVILLLTLICFVFGYPLLPEDQRVLGDLWLASEGTPTEEGAKIIEGSCEALINKALEVSDTGCQRIGRNEICYGNYDITANVNPDFSGKFDLVGDVIPISGVKQIYASPLDMAKNLWGVAVLKLQANLPGTVPGQNVTFMVFGDTSVDNVSGDMSAFYFATGFAGVRCSQVPFDGLLIEMPDGSGISFQANGVDFMLQGDAILQANPGGELTVSMIDGTGMVRAEGEIQEIGPGTSVSVPLNDDLNPTGPPSDPSDLSDDDVLLSCHLLGIGCPPDIDVIIRPPTSTPGSEDPGQPTNTPAPVDPGIPTNTPVPVPSGQPTNTSVPLPTNTSAPLPTNTPPPAATNTSPPPAATNTSPPAATNTPIPPTPTNTSAPPTATIVNCSAITTGGISTDDSTKTMEFNIVNNSGGEIRIETLTLTWPVSHNGALEAITLRTSPIFNVVVPSSPLSIPAQYAWSTGSGTRRLDNGQSGTLAFTFELGAQSSGYAVSIGFENGCVINK